MLVPNLGKLPLLIALGITGGTVMAQDSGRTIIPAEVQWKAGRVAGLERANLVGEPGKPGPVIFRLKFPPGYIVHAHSFPDDRTYTVLSGTWYLGWGTKFDDTKLKALPAGSFYTIPANVPHFVATKAEAVIVQVSGTEPSGVRYVDPSHAPK